MAELSVDQKRAAVKAGKAEFGMNQMLEIVGLNRSSYYYQPDRSQQQQTDEALANALKAEAGKHPFFGARRLRKYVRQKKRWDGVGLRRVQRVLKAAGITRKRRRYGVRTTNSVHGFQRYPNLVKHLVTTYPNQVWACDITYITLGMGEVVYLAAVLDVFTRVVRGWDLSRSIDHQLTLCALNQALRKGTPAIHHSDQGVQYATPKYTSRLLRLDVKLSMAAVGKAWENGYAERFMRTLKEEEVVISEYDDFNDARKQIGGFIDAVYNRKRMHSSIADLSPMRFEKQWRVQHAKSLS